MGGRCNLDIGLGAGETGQLSQGSRAVARNTAFAGTVKVSPCCGTLRLGLPERLVNFPGFPKMMQQNRQLSDDCRHCALLSASAATGCELKAPPPHVGIWAERTENVMRSLDQQTHRE